MRRKWKGICGFLLPPQFLLYCFQSSSCFWSHCQFLPNCFNSFLSILSIHFQFLLSFLPIASQSLSISFTVSSQLLLSTSQLQKLVRFSWNELERNFWILSSSPIGLQFFSQLLHCQFLFLTISPFLSFLPVSHQFPFHTQLLQQVLPPIVSHSLPN